MKTNNNKSSARKKLVPAVAMLTASAVMLSTATYAWFTMNKEVEVTGLKMAATAGDSLEITLGELGKKTGDNKSDGVPNTATFGSVEDLGWGRLEDIDSYYKLISKLKPASTDTALSIYKVDENEIYAGGQAVTSDAVVATLNETDMASIALDAKYKTEALTNDETADGYKEGYYVDIPMWIRSSNLEERDVNAYVKIIDPTASEDPGNGSDLINAVRVALIPIASTKDLSTASNLGYTAAGTRAVDSVASNATIFGLTKTTYKDAVLTSGTKYSDAITGTTTINQAASAFGKNVDDSFKATYDKGTIETSDDETVAGVKVFKMPAADKDKYAAVLVVARVWIEGESTHCNDATANQDWSIDFHFELADATPVVPGP